MAIFTGSELKARPSLGSEMDHATDASAAFARVEPLLLPSQLVNRQLAGIPLYSALPDPVTKQRFNFGAPDVLNDFIEGAIGQVELETGLRVTPVEVTRRLAFDLPEYRQMGYVRVPDAPVLKVLSLSVTDASLNVIFSIPTQWIDVGHLQRGQINLLPLQPAFVGAGTVGTSDSAGGAAFIALMGARSWVASWWTIQYVTGFAEGRVPRVLNDLVGCRAAVNILQRIQATNKVASYGISLDGAGQNITTPGVQLYSQAIELLEKDYKTISSKLKARFGKKIFSDNC